MAITISGDTPNFSSATITTGTVTTLTAPTSTITTLNAPSGVLATQNGMTGIAKAWISYNGSAQTIYSSFNCSSVTYNSATNYTFNFTNVMPNANYAVLCTIGGAVNQAGLAPWGTPTASSFVFTMGGSTNPTYVSVAVFSS